MCFASNNSGSNKTSAGVTQGLADDPRAFFRFWNPPEIAKPTLQLNDQATDRADLSKKKQGTKRFQVPLTHAGGAGLGIPTKKKQGG